MGALVLGLTGLAAQAQPIQSAKDQACRDEARARVFSTPDPRGLGPYELGRQIYFTCMKRGAKAGGKRTRRG
ncbi:hypothetical protein OPKNFCMD_5201 [Methylobacterium crusticola]|uniref:Uncharacterized protein n=1 Tax=Methylobacterium crusticola TaxID=1697972 RepID=A0ABQ4R558_9HYPH|nr:hypothetical protein [Methylobacterium crusticola]GJD52436.1 hypothetical protein OPKNFCMD_5201 [Methylobacterium crusticola]